MLGEDAFGEGAGVGISARSERFWIFFVNGGEQGVEFFPEDFMVVGSPGVARDPAAGRRGIVRGSVCNRRGMRGVVVQRADDDAACVFEDEGRIATARVGEIAHFTGVAAGEPFVEIGEFGKFFRADDGAK